MSVQNENRLQFVTKTAVKTQTKTRLIIGGSMLAVALLFGISVFMFGNFGNNTESLAAANQKNGSKNSIAPEGPSRIKVSVRENQISLSWTNIIAKKKTEETLTTGILILRRQGLICEDQPLDASFSAEAKTSYNGWDIVYYGSLISNFKDEKALSGTFTYLIYERNNEVNFSDAKDAARIFVLNGNNISENLNANVKLDGLYIPENSTLTIEEEATLAFDRTSSVDVSGKIVLKGELKNETTFLTFKNGSQFIYARNENAKYGIPKATWESGANCIITGVFHNLPDNLSQSFGNFVWDCPNQNVDLTIPAEFTVNGSLEIKSTGSSDKSIAFSGTSTLNGDAVVYDNAKIETKNKSNIIFNGKAQQSIRGQWNLQNVTFNNPVGFSIDGNVSVNKTIELVNGKINFLNNASLKIGDEVTINRTNGSLSGEPVFAGTYNLNYFAPCITGEELSTSNIALANLKINCDGNVVLSKTVFVNNSLEFLKGKIVTGNYNVNLKNNAEKSLKGYSSAGYVVGNLRRAVDGKGVYDFPVGTSGNYELLNIKLSKTEGFTNILAHFTKENPDEQPMAEIRLNGSLVSSTLDYGYWTLTPNGEITSGNYAVTLNAKGQSNHAKSERCYCILNRQNNSSPWNLNGIHSMKTQHVSQGTVTAARTRVTSMGDFTIGFSDAALLLYQSSFSATLIDKKFTDLTWRTSVEVKYSSLIAERSSNANDFVSLGELIPEETNTSSIEYNLRDSNPIPGKSFYRIKQIDADGKISYSNISFVNNESGTQASLNTEK